MFDPSVASMTPGPQLAAALAGCDLADMDADQTLTWLSAWQRMAGWVEAASVQGVAHFADLRNGHDLAGDGVVGLPGRERQRRLGGSGTPKVAEFAADELAAELGMSSMRAGGLIADALDLRHRLPAVLAGLAAGTVEGWRARLVARGTRELSAAQAAGVEAEVLPQLAQVTSARLRKLVEAAAIAADPEAADRQAEGAARSRFVERGASDQGLSPLFAPLDTAAAIRLDAGVDQVADRLTELGDDRPKDELRAVALGLLAEPAAVQSLWQRVCAARAGRPVPPEAAAPVPATTLYVHHTTGADGQPRWSLEGIGAITEREARDLIGHSAVTVKPVIDLHQEVTCAGYQTSERLREVQVLLNPECYFPFCTANARNGDYDHVIPSPRGPTSSTNGALPCRHHHRTKTHGKWVVKEPFPGIYVWRSPTGRIYLVDRRGNTTSLGRAA